MKRISLEVRRSKIQGLGAFATRPIAKEERIIEYAGERITPAEADRRYQDDHRADFKVLLFIVNQRTVIDAGIDGNEARFINHSCDPNSQAVIRLGHVYITALRRIQVGEELTYDYNLTRDGLLPTDAERRYACHCGAKKCRGTMLQVESAAPS